MLDSFPKEALLNGAEGRVGNRLSLPCSLFLCWHKACPETQRGHSVVEWRGVEPKRKAIRRL